MAFGPSDRSEVIELKGLEEHEREREGMLVHAAEPLCCGHLGDLVKCPV